MQALFQNWFVRGEKERGLIKDVRKAQRNDRKNWVRTRTFIEKRECKEAVQRRQQGRTVTQYGRLPYHQVPARNEMREAFEKDDSGEIESGEVAPRCSRLHQSHRTRVPW
jgi:hypothetical protein